MLITAGPVCMLIVCDRLKQISTTAVLQPRRHCRQYPLGAQQCHLPTGGTLWVGHRVHIDLQNKGVVSAQLPCFQCCIDKASDGGKAALKARVTSCSYAGKESTAPMYEC